MLYFQYLTSNENIHTAEMLQNSPEIRLQLILRARPLFEPPICGALMEKPNSGASRNYDNRR